MNHLRIPRLVFILLVVLVIISVGFAFAANNIVPTTRLTDQSQTIDANTLKPAACSGLTLNAIVICTGGKCNGTNSDELIIGTSGYDDIKGKNGDDCIIGGDGDDDISGDNGTDVCIGGPGNDSFTNKCETQIQ
jgi:Ca2+-binding RTX toxin-like protein